MQPNAIRTRLVQLDVRPGRPAENAARMLEHVRQAAADRVALLVFPEMAVPGYLLGDEWERPAFLRDCEEAARELAAATRGCAGLAVVFGSVGLDWNRRNEDGRVRKYNALFVAENGHCLGPESGPYDFVVKTLLPNYREFDDSRHFFDLRKLALEVNRPVHELLAPVRTSRLRLGCMLCEDAWDMDYAVSPMAVLARAGADMIVNISSSPFTAGKDHKRKRVFAARASELCLPIAYANNVGLQNNGKTVFTFDGASCIYDACGGCAQALAPFEEGTLTADVPLDGATRLGPAPRPPPEDIAGIARALRYGTERFMAQCGVRRVVVGISGGIDSAVVATLYRRILPPDRLLLVNMPGPYTSPTTRALARELAAGLGALYAEADIAESVALTRRQLQGLVARSPDGRFAHALDLGDSVLENVQARDRSARVLAAVAAAFGGVFTCNANKSEATVGYTTLYGDLGGYLANIADLWKTEVYALARHLNAASPGPPPIPRGCLDLVPSAELSAAQNVDAGRGDPLIYPYHDRLFETWVERWDRLTPEELAGAYRDGNLEALIGYNGRVADLFPGAREFIADLEHWWDLYQGMGVAKRIQAPPVLAVKRRAFGFDHREAQMGPRYTRRYAAVKRELLGGCE